jgi:hypothetical protein
LEIRPSLTALLDPTRRDSSALLQRLQPGQTLQATVLGVPRAGIAQLQIGLTALLARTRVELQPGMQLQLAVARLNPLPELKVLTPPPPVQARDLVFRAALPRQLPLAETFTGLARTLQTSAEQWPPPVRAAVARVLERAVGPQQLDARQVQQQFRSSGLFLEPLLARGETPTTDLKLDLLRLLQLLRPLLPDRPPASAAADQPRAAPRPDAPGLPPQPDLPGRSPAVLQQLLRLVEAAVSRVQTHQAASLPQDASAPRPAWQFELPLLAGQQQDAVLVRIEHDDSGTTDRPAAEHHWTVTLRFDFASTGRMQARVSLAGERVSSTFWCEHPETERRLGVGLAHLEQALREAGLEVGRLASVLGPPPQPLDLPRPTDNLLDAHA